MIVLHSFTLLCTWYIHTARLPAPPCADKEPKPDSGAEKAAESCSQGRSRYWGPSALSCSTSTQSCQMWSSTACGGQGGWATMFFPSPVAHAPALNRSNAPPPLRKETYVSKVQSEVSTLHAALLKCSRAVDHHSCCWCCSYITLQHNCQCSK